MQGKVLARGLVDSYRIYVEVLEAVGHSVDCAALAEYLGEDEAQREELRGLLAQGEGSEKRQVPAKAAERMQELMQTLLADMSAFAGEGAGSKGGPVELAKALRARSADERECAADAALLNGHRRFLQPRYISLEQFHEALRQGQDGMHLALVKLVPYLREELEKRGFAIPEVEIRQWFEPGCESRQVPFCLRRIVGGLDGEFSARLISLSEMVGEQEPDEWLEAVRQRLQFRSHSAMHKAIAEATSLKYDCVHKALSGRRKAKRVQSEIKYCLEKWLRDVGDGREPDIDEDHRGVPVEQMHALLQALEARFGTKEKVYRLISSRTGIKTGSVRRYFQSNGQLRYAPLAVYRCAQGMTGEGVPEALRRSYLANRRIRRAAFEIAREADEALRRWRSMGDNPELEIAYKELRRALIITIKEGRDAAHAWA